MSAADDLKRDLDFAIQAGDVELAQAIGAKLTALSPSAPKPIERGGNVGSVFDAPKLNDTATQIAENPFTRFAVGAGKSAVGAGQFISNLALSGMSPDLNAAVNRNVWDPLAGSIKRTEQMGQQPDGGWNVAGTAGEVLSPVGLGLGKGLAAAPKIGGKIMQGSAFGAGLGAAQPVTGDSYDQQKLGQIGSGATVGALFPAITGTAQKFIGRPVSEFFTYILGPQGAEKLATRHANEVVGADNVQKLVAEIKQQLPGTGGGIVRGYQPTTGEMVAHMPESTGWQAIQSTAARSPQGSVGYGLRAAEQRGALDAAMTGVAGTEPQLAAAQAARSAAADKAYALAAQFPVRADQALVDISKNPYFADAVPKAMEMAKASGQTDTTSILHNVKVILDAQLGKTGNEAVNRSERRIIGDLQRNLVTWLDTANPAYKAAREQFQTASVPINRMQVGQELQSKLVAPTDQMTPGNYLRAIEDAPKLIKDATGRPRSTLNQIFTPQQASTVNEVGSLLERKLASQKPLQPTALGDAQNSGVKLDLPHMLSTPIVLTNFILRSLSQGQGGLEAGVQRVNALRGLYPEKFVEAMKLVPPTKRQEIMAMLAGQGVTPMNQGLIAPAAQGLFDFQNQQ